MRVIGTANSSVATGTGRPRASALCAKKPSTANNAGVKTGRVGAAAFALGLFLTGLQTAAVATADTTDDSSPASAQTAGADATSGNGRARGASPRSKPAAEIRTSDSGTREASGGATRSPAPSAARTARSSATVSESATRSADSRSAPQPAATVPATARAQSGVRAEVSVPQPLSSATTVVVDHDPVEDPDASTAAPAIRMTVRIPAATVPSAAPIAKAARAVIDPNTLAQGFFTDLNDLLDTLPSPEATEYLQGALLMLRRNLFNQAAIASPVQTSFDPEDLRATITGGIGAEDPEGDALTYQVVTGPQHGTVVVDTDGEYVYTPGESFTGQDSFSVTVTSAGSGINLLDLGGEHTTTVEVLVGTTAPTNPFSARNIRDVSLYLGGVPVSAKLAKKNFLTGIQTASITIRTDDDAQVTWLDDQGHIGHVSVADLTAQWAGFTSAGNVRLGINFTLEDGTPAALILTSVNGIQGAGSGEYVFSGDLAPDPVNGVGVDSYYDITGGSQKTAYGNFRSAYLRIAEVNGLEFAVEAADLYADSYSLSNYKEALQGTDPGIVIEPGGPGEAAAAGITSDSPFNEATLSAAVEFAKNGGKAFNANDPLFYANLGLKPKCMATWSCDGSFYPVTSYSEPKTLMGAEKVWDLGGGTGLRLSYDMGYTLYGYVYVPAGVWGKLNESNYSAALLTAVTTGPSLTVGFGNNKLPLNAKPFTLVGPSTLYVYPPFFEVSGKIDASVDATFAMADGVEMKKLGAHLYYTGGLLTTYNVVQSSGFDFQYTGAGAKFTFDDFSAVRGVTISPTLSPSLTATAGLLTPASTPLIGQFALMALSLTYANPLSLDLKLSPTTQPELRFRSAGEMSFGVGVLPTLTDKLSIKSPAFKVYKYTSDNLFEPSKV